MSGRGGRGAPRVFSAASVGKQPTDEPEQVSALLEIGGGELALGARFAWARCFAGELPRCTVVCSRRAVVRGCLRRRVWIIYGSRPCSIWVVPVASQCKMPISGSGVACNFGKPAAGPCSGLPAGIPTALQQTQGRDELDQHLFPATREGRFARRMPCLLRSTMLGYKPAFRRRLRLHRRDRCNPATSTAISGRSVGVGVPGARFSGEGEPLGELVAQTG